MNTIKKIGLTLLAGIVFFPAAAQQTPSGSFRLTLEECLDYAMGNNYTRQSKQLDEESYETSYNQSKMERLPGLSGSVTEGVSHTQNNSAAWTGSLGVDVGMTLYQGGNVKNTIQQSKLQMEQAGYQTAKYDNELTIQILQTFLTILGNEELLKYQQSVIVASEEQLKQGYEQYIAGKILESDYLMLEAQLASDRNSVVETKASRDNNLLSLKALLSMDMAVDLQIISPDTTVITQMEVIPTQNYVTGRAMETLPDLTILDYGVEIAKTGVEIARSGYYPTLSLSGSLSTGHADFSGFSSQLSDRFNQKAGLSLSVPIFNRGRTKAQVTKSKISLQQAELSQKQNELTVLQTVIQEYRNVETALDKFHTSSVRENAYRRTFETYRSQFNEGSITPVDLLQQQNNYISALNDFVQSKYSFMLRRKILDVYTGETITM